MDPGHDPAGHDREHHPQAAPAAAHHRQPHPRRTPQCRPIQPAVPRPPHRRPRGTTGPTGTHRRHDPWPCKANRTTRRIPIAPRGRREHVSSVRAQDTRGARSLTVGKIDEADRLKTAGLEQLRDFFDRHDLGVILIGMPGFDRQLARYPQLYSRIGFAHQYKPLDPEDIPAVLTHYGQQLGLHDTNLGPVGELVGTIVRITAGNFRLIERLMTQVGRLMDINGFDDISPDLITAARQTLVIGTQ
ncbi:MAG TPA: AAA family ATPase [Nakamurella sp.]|nr:AAA family ATPase [Nakamurella sp.]